jgi:hypothetical protein
MIARSTCTQPCKTQITGEARDVASLGEVTLFKLSTGGMKQALERRWDLVVKLTIRQKDRCAKTCFVCYRSLSLAI